MVNYSSDQPLECVGCEIITGLSSVKTLTPASGAIYALIQAQTQNVRMRDDGTNPTSSQGLILTAGAVPMFYSGNLSAPKFIEATASAAIFVSYYRPRTLAHGSTSTVG